MTATRIDPDELLPSNPDGKATPVPVFYDTVIAAINEHADELDHGAYADARSYGATGDGETDDTAALQRGIDSSENVTLVLRPNSTYVVSAPLKKASGSLRINAYGATILLKSTYPAQIEETGVIDARTLDEFSVFGLTIDGNSTALNGGAGFPDWQNFIEMILARDVTSVRIRDCHVKNFPSLGIQARSCERVVIESNRVEDGMFHPIYVKLSDDVRVVSNVVVGRGNVGTDPLIGGIGIHFDVCDYVDASGNHVSNTGDTGLKGQGCDYVNCERNTIENAGKDGIKFQGITPDTSPSFVCVVNNAVNRINAWRTDGSSLILIADYLGAYIGGNQVRGGGTRVADGIRCTLWEGAQLQRYTIEDNLGELIDGYGINAGTVKDFIIRGNRFDGAIHVAGADGEMLIEGNSVSNGGVIDSTNNGIEVSNVSSGTVVVRDNAVSDHAAGVAVYASAGVTLDAVTIADNVIKNCYQFGVRVDNFGASSSTIRSLAIRGNNCRDTSAGIASSSCVRIGTTQLSIDVARVTHNTIQNLTANAITNWLELTGTATDKIALLDLTGTFVVAGMTAGYTIGSPTRATVIRGLSESAPAQLTASQNDYGPSGMTEVLILSSNANVDITGFKNGAILRSLYVYNNGTFNITLKHQNAGSVVGADRIIGRGGADTVLTPNTGVYMYWPSSVIGRWLIVADSL